MLIPKTFNFRWSVSSKFFFISTWFTFQVFFAYNFNSLESCNTFSSVLMARSEKNTKMFIRFYFTNAFALHCRQFLLSSWKLFMCFAIVFVFVNECWNWNFQPKICTISTLNRSFFSMFRQNDWFQLVYFDKHFSHFRSLWRFSFNFCIEQEFIVILKRINFFFSLFFQYWLRRSSNYNYNKILKIMSNWNMFAL